ncbi:hypothetical protein SAMN05660236_5537 [Ohtaekwangia koreensis]|uniref:Uncharacterized protein n=1 Tax=Ohtaekwangia koreensis TaxID=688867 RepID=A0A1T5MI29_9BACT|nr:hypothetical protein SAMN05660236_5537 [Ohtaekwangia koreensis]
MLDDESSHLNTELIKMKYDKANTTLLKEKASLEMDNDKDIYKR